MHTDLGLYVRTGAGPAGEIMGQYKLYSVDRLDMKGLRLRAVPTVRLPGWRGFEAQWFAAYKGAKARLSDPGVAG